MKLFISPHNDDSELFGCFTLIREKPDVWVVTDSYIQANRGEGITAEQRRKETMEAHVILGLKTYFSHLRDDELTKEQVSLVAKYFDKYDTFYAPKPYENGNPQHNMIGEVAKELFGDKVIFYSTYTKDNLYMTGKTEIRPTPEELELKHQALQCYESQIQLPATRPHFEAVYGRSEWYD